MFDLLDGLTTVLDGGGNDGANRSERDADIFACDAERDTVAVGEGGETRSSRFLREGSEGSESEASVSFNVAGGFRLTVAIADDDGGILGGAATRVEDATSVRLIGSVFGGFKTGAMTDTMVDPFEFGIPAVSLSAEFDELVGLRFIPKGKRRSSPEARA